MFVDNKHVKLYGSENSIGDPLASIIIYVGIVSTNHLGGHSSFNILPI